ncbi:MAG: amidohydrolase family protein, partial [Terriglobales bacterium]
MKAPVVALEHAWLMDGTGAPAQPDQTIVIEHGRIQAVGPAASVSVPSGAEVLDLHGDTVIPGLVGIHDHMFYPAPFAGLPATRNEMAFSFPRLYLAGGVTTVRTVAGIEPYTDLNLKKLIDTGRIPGPHLVVAGPFLEGKGAFTAVQMHELSGPADAVRTVQYWEAEGVTTFNAYRHITRAELAAAVKAVHARGYTITIHVCSIGFREAAALGVDSLDHGLEVDTEFDPGKQPDVCPPANVTEATLAHLDVASAPVQDMIRDLVARHVSVTSTLPVFEAGVPGRPPLEPRFLQVLSAPSRAAYLLARVRSDERPGASAAIFKKEMQFEYDFVRAGGRLLTGLDPTGNGGVVAGFGDQRELELLVEAGFTPVEAVHCATENGAQFLKMANTIGTI